MSEIILKTDEIIVNSTKTNFDKACDYAYKMALMRFNIDDCGHSDRIFHWERYTCWIEVEFIKYIRKGNSHYYHFIANAMKSEDED